MRGKILRLVPTVLGIFLAFMGVGPQDAELNFCKWVGLIITVPHQCLNGIPSQILWIIIGALIVSGGAWFKWPASPYLEQGILADIPYSINGTSEISPKKDWIHLALDQQHRIDLGLEINPKSLKLEVGESGEFIKTKRRSPYSFKRTLYLKVENIDGRFSVSDCKVRVLKIEPQEEYCGPWILREGINLAAGDHEFIPFIEYGEADKSNHESSNITGDSFMEVLVSEPTPKLSAYAEYIVTLKATSFETSPTEFQCKLWVDENGRLRISAGGDAATVVGV